MGYTEKIDVLDLLINILKEHEGKLDGLVARIEATQDMVQVSGLLKPVGGSLMLIIPKQIAVKHGMRRGDSVTAYIKKAG